MIWFLSGGKSTILSAIEGSPVSNFWFLLDYKKIGQEENNGPEESTPAATSAKLHLTLCKKLIFPQSVFLIHLGINIKVIIDLGINIKVILR